MGEHRRNLERPDEPQPRDVGRLEIGDVAPVERDPTAGRRDEFRQHVETGRLARAVRPDQRVDRPTLDAERNVADRAEITEALAEAFRDENIVHAHSRRSAERMRFPPMNAKVYQAAGAAVVKPKKATLRPRSDWPRSGSRRWSEAPAPLKFGRFDYPSVLRLCSRRSQSSAWRTMSSRLSRVGFQPSTLLARSALATMAAGSPARRPETTTGKSIPDTRLTTSTTSLTVSPCP